MKNERTDDERTGGNYPYYPLAVCLPIADAVKALGGGKTPVSKSLLAQTLNEDEKSQTISFKLASAKSFGLIDGRTAFSLTEIAKRYYFPTDESDRQNALLDFLAYPPAFKNVIERFDGSTLPSAEILGNILHREYGVPESWKVRVAGFFIRSAQSVAAMDEGGHLRVKASRDGRAVNNVPAPEPEISASSAEVIRQQARPAPRNADSKIWSATEDNRTILVETPRDITGQEWNDLNQYVQRIKPKDKSN